MARFPITGLRSVDLTVPDLAAAIDFYTAVWGLDLADRSGERAWLRATGTDSHVVALHAGHAPDIRSMTFRLADDSDPAALCESALAHGATLLHAARAAAFCSAIAVSKPLRSTDRPRPRRASSVRS